ncbi:MAG: A24 family peptidase C-terminal domain-containing protein [Methanomassiliicoccales archaeon]|jgi:preflagellin peptidase FlaK|nr:A24 family peptidase C-terminal domain-containing protein [Methanomassiliicoccales archaeon]
MEEMEYIRVFASFFILLSASISDWKARLAADMHWILLGIIGLAILVIDLYLSGASPIYYLFIIPIAIIFFDIFWDRKGILEDGINIIPLFLYLIALAVLIFLAINFWDQLLYWELMTIIIMFGIIILFYNLNIIKGGADAKALLALSISFPHYPVIGQFPIIDIPSTLNELLFPFSLLILFNAALLSVAVPIALFFFNFFRGDKRIPVMFFGYRVNINEVQLKFVWPLEYFDGEKIRLTIFPRSDDSVETQLRNLKQLGFEKIWVTPKIPFLIPITISLLFSVVVGNLIFLMIA